MEISEGNSSLQFTENSIKVVANIINNIGTDPNDKTGKTLHQNIVRTQDDIFQPLKHSDIHIMPTVGAVKQGAGNIIVSKMALTLMGLSMAGTGSQR